MEDNNRVRLFQLVFRTTPVRRFLEASLLSTDAQSSDEEANRPVRGLLPPTLRATNSPFRARKLLLPLAMRPRDWNGRL